MGFSFKKKNATKSSVDDNDAIHEDEDAEHQGLDMPSAADDDDDDDNDVIALDNAAVEFDDDASAAIDAERLEGASSSAAAAGGGGSSSFMGRSFFGKKKSATDNNNDNVDVEEGDNAADNAIVGDEEGGDDDLLLSEEVAEKEDEIVGQGGDGEEEASSKKWGGLFGKKSATAASASAAASTAAAVEGADEEGAGTSPPETIENEAVAESDGGDVDEEKNDELLEYGDDNDDDDIPPPPPPPQNGRKKKIALAAVGVTAVALALGLGLGLRDDNANANNQSGGGASDASSGADTTGTATTPTEATTAVVADVDVDEGITGGTNPTSVAEFDGITTTESPPTNPAETIITSSEQLTEEDIADAEIYNTIVVGAGWAGLRAIDILLNAGVDKSIVLEASDRVGGRCWSVNSDGSTNSVIVGEDTIPYDIGAEWNYDSDSNDQQDVLFEEGIMPERLWENDNYYAIWPTGPGKATYYLQSTDGTAEKMDGDGMLEDIWDPFIEYRQDNLNELEGKSYGEAIEEYIDQWDDWTIDELQFLNLVEDAKLMESGTSDYDMDIFTDPTLVQGETVYMGVPGLGWGNVAADYASKFQGNIKLNAKVTEINSSVDDEYAVVVYEDQSTGERNVIKAKTILVTVSLGVLQANSIKFVPIMPEYKQTSIDATGFGLINKCIMSWDNEDAMVWPEDEGWFMLVTPEKDTSGQWTTFSNPSKFKGVPSLTAWIGGKDAIAAENQKDEDILSHVMKNLKAMFPTITEPDNFIISRWGQEEFVRGAYAFPRPGQDYYKDLDNISQRMGKIYFAGEATSRTGRGTTFGAWKTGEEQALRIAERVTGE